MDEVINRCHIEKVYYSFIQGPYLMSGNRRIINEIPHIFKDDKSSFGGIFFGFGASNYCDHCGLQASGNVRKCRSKKKLKETFFSSK